MYHFDKLDKEIYKKMFKKQPQKELKVGTGIAQIKIKISFSNVDYSAIPAEHGGLLRRTSCLKGVKRKI